MAYKAPGYLPFGRANDDERRGGEDLWGNDEWSSIFGLVGVVGRCYRAYDCSGVYGNGEELLESGDSVGS